MVLPYANGDCMDIYLEEFSKQFSDYRVIMAMDNAAWHNSRFSQKTDNILPLFQPPYSPEVNPAEHIWHYIRENGYFKNKTFNSIKEVEDQLCLAVNTLLADKEKVISITCFSWIKKVISGNMVAG